MKRRIARAFLRRALRLRGPNCAHALNLFFKYTQRSIRLEYSDGMYIIRDFPEMAILHAERLPWYFEGVMPRLNLLEEQYMLERICFSAGEVVIDCGANIGELGLILKHRAEAVRYIAFEPGEEECRALRKNNPDQEVIEMGLWSEAGALDFYVKSETADSSFFQIAQHRGIVKVPVTTIDEFISGEKIDRIKLLKLEAEGAEPEVLSGALQSLRKIEYVAADVGPERGVASDNTLCRVLNPLLEHGFEVIGFHHVRCTLLLRNKMLHSQ